MSTACANCPVCENHSSSSMFDVYDDRYGYPGYFTLIKCLNCGHIFLNVKFAPEQISNLYSVYYQRSTFQVDEHHPYEECSGVTAWLDGARSNAYLWVPPEVRILDIGCGFGGTLGYHIARGCDVYGVETDENIRRVAEKFGYKVHVGLFDATNYRPDSFDYVTMDQVMEHVQNPTEVLNGVAQILRSGGIAILSIPNANGLGARIFGRFWIHWHAPYHLQFYSEKSMLSLLRKTGFTLERIERITSSSWLYYQLIHLLTRPAEGVPSKFWTLQGQYNIVLTVMTKILYLLHVIKVTHLITRCLDLMAIGDNILYFIKKNDV